MPKVATIVEDAAYETGSDDVVGFVKRTGVLSAWAIDGASVLSETQFVNFPDRTDSRWFADRISAYLSDELAERPFSHEGLYTAIKMIRDQYLQIAKATPIWAHPLVALALVEVRHIKGGFELVVNQFADCFVLYKQLNRLPNVTHCKVQPCQARKWKPSSGFSGETLEALRARRQRQQMGFDTTALTLNPDSVGQGLPMTSSVISGATHILIGTDGLSRAWELYDIINRAAVVEEVVERGLDGVVADIRRYEASNYHKPDGVKASDDASGVHIFCE